MSHPCKRVLVIEDDHDLLEALGEYLAAQGIEATLVSDGVEALAALERGPPPDLILLDLTIPGVSSVGILERLQADAALARIPVAAMSGLGRRHYAYLPHVDAFLAKPFDLALLNRVLSNLCERRRGAEALA